MMVDVLSRMLQSNLVLALWALILAWLAQGENGVADATAPSPLLYAFLELVILTVISFAVLKIVTSIAYRLHNRFPTR